jgi:hypothetical protein
MNPDSIPQLSLGTAALIIFLVCAGFVMLRGMTRMIVGTVVLAISAWIGFIVWQKAPTLSVEWFGKSIGFITTGLPIAAFLVSYYLLRKIATAIARPFGGSSHDGKPPSSPIIRLAFRLLLALIPTSLILLIGAVLIHHTGSIAEVRAVSEKNPGDPEPAPALLSQRLKSSIENALPASWLKALDPLAEPSRLALAKAIAAQSDTPPKPFIDPRTGEAFPRAIIVDDPELQNLAREGKFGTLLRHPLLTQALSDPKVQALLKDLNL